MLCGIPLMLSTGEFAHIVRCQKAMCVQLSISPHRKFVLLTDVPLQCQVTNDGRRLLGADDGGLEWREYTPYHADQEYDDDEAVEDYYMSSAAGRARVVFGNRRWGNSG